MSGTDRYRPRYHFTPPRGWMNDPNGLVYHAGRYHLFYQHHPASPLWGPMHWGHAVSRDLVTWEHRPVALAPDDALGAAFSGSALVDEEDASGLGEPGNPCLAAMLTHAGGRDGTQKQSLAVSRDAGRTWHLHPDNPVLPNPGVADFRDPRVFWYAPAGRFVMVLAVGNHVVFYASADLVRWRRTGEFGREFGAHGGVWECPDLFELPVEGAPGDSRWVLLVGIGDGGAAGGSGTQYFIGHFDGDTFHPDGPPGQVRWADSGPDFYAAQTWSGLEAQGRRVAIAWMNNWRYAEATPTTTWRGAMTLPRELSLRRLPNGSVRLVQRPVAEVVTLRRGPVEALGEGGTALELEAVLTPTPAATSEIEVLAGAGPGVRVGWNPGKNTLFLDRTGAGRFDFAPEFAGRYEVDRLSKSPEVPVRVFVDRCSVEVFFDDGLVSLTALAFPRPDAVHVRFPVPAGGRLTGAWAL